MDLSFKTGQKIDQSQRGTCIEVAIKFTNYKDIQTLRRAFDWFYITVKTCRTFRDQGFELFNVSSFYETKHWLNWSAMSTSHNNPVVQVGEQMIKQTETILGDMLGSQYISALRDFFFEEHYDEDQDKVYAMVWITFDSEDLAGFTEQEQRDIAQDIKENEAVRAHFESAKTISLDKTPR